MIQGVTLILTLVFVAIYFPSRPQLAPTASAVAARLSISEVCAVSSICYFVSSVDKLYPPDSIVYAVEIDPLLADLDNFFVLFLLRFSVKEHGKLRDGKVLTMTMIEVSIPLVKAFKGSMARRWSCTTTLHRC